VKHATIPIINKVFANNLKYVFLPSTSSLEISVLKYTNLAVTADDFVVFSNLQRKRQVGALQLCVASQIGLVFENLRSKQKDRRNNV
jgi:hypothetical protein